MTIPDKIPSQPFVRIADVELYHAWLKQNHPDLADYVLAMNHEGPHSYNWKDKPHRLVYELVRLCAEAREVTK